MSENKLSTASLVGVGIGGIIGAGFFLGTGLAVHEAGPSVALSFLAGGLIMIQVLGAITSIHVNRLALGSFRVYTEEFMGPFVGFVQGWAVFISSVLTMSAEAVGMGTFVNYWLPHVSLPVTATAFTVLVIGLNAFGIGAFGSLESGMSVIKTLVIVLFIFSGIYMLAAHGNTFVQPKPFSGLNAFFPTGIHGFLQSMLIVVFCFAGISAIAMASTNAENPIKDIPRAVSVVSIGIVLLYAASMLVLVSVTPWQTVNTSKSPFVQAFDALNMPQAAAALNFIILIAAFSVMAATYYSATQILVSLANTKKAPAAVAYVQKNGLYRNAWLVVGGTALVIIGISFILPHRLFNYLISASSYFTFQNWVLNVITYLIWLKRRKPGDVYKSPLILGKPGAYFTILAILVLAVISLRVADFRMGFYAALTVILVIILAYVIWSKYSRQEQEHRLK